MTSKWLKIFEERPIEARVVPFVVFVGLTALQGHLGPSSLFWLYLVKSIAGAILLLSLRPLLSEMRWRWSWMACAVGVAVFGIWVALEPYYPSLGDLQDRAFGNDGATEPEPEETSTSWNPFGFFDSSVLAWFFVIVRIVGSSLVVPPLEEVFYRSFLYRWVAKPDFLSVPLSHFAIFPFIFTSVIFGLAHYQWLAGILCGLAYQGLVCWRGNLGEAITAHAITNALLGVWVVWMEAWHFW